MLGRFAPGIRRADGPGQVTGDVRQNNMAFTEEQRHAVEAELSAFMALRRPPEHIRDRLDLGFRCEDSSVIIFEIRPRWNDPNERTEHPVAKARYFKSRDSWTVYWMRADLKWHIYPPLAEVRHIGDFLDEVDSDPNACFWG